MAHRHPALRPGFESSVGLLALCLLALLTAIPCRLRADTGPVVPGLEACDRAMRQILRTTGAPGGALAVACDGRIVYARGFGYIDRAGSRPVQPDTRFRIASASKAVTAALILRLVEQGRLSLDDRAFALLNLPAPTYAGATRDPRLDSITIRQLLSHSAGWDRGTGRNPFTGGTGFDPVDYGSQIAQALGTPPPASTAALVRYMSGQPLQFNPGGAFVYSNVGFLVAGQLIEQKTGRPYAEAVREFLEPSFISGFRIGASRRAELAFDDSDYWDGNAYGISAFGEGTVPTPYMFSLPSIAPAGGWCVSAIEYVRFLLALEGTTDVPPLLEPASVQQMRTTQRPSTDYGLGWFTVFPAPGAGSGHPGALPGTWSWGLRRDGGRVQLMALINGFSNISLVSGQIWDALRPAADAIVRAPEADLTWSTLGWDAWRLWRFASEPSTELGDPDGDGLPNLIEYAAGLDPRSPDRAAVGGLVLTSAGSPELQFRRILLEHQVSWSAEVTADEVSWRGLSLAEVSTSLNPDGTLTARVVAPNAIAARLRIRRIENGAEASLEFRLAPQLTILRHPVSQTVAPGGSVELSVATTDGDAVTYQWFHDGVAIAGAVGARLTLDDVSGASAGEYTVRITAAADSITSRAARIVVALPVAGDLVNFSVRGVAGREGQPLIAGFVVAGGSKPLLIRAIGPGMPGAGDIELMPDPRLDVHAFVAERDAILASNDNWGAAASDRALLTEVFARTGAFPLAADSGDAAVLLTSGGVRTVHVNGGRGTALVEIYDADSTSAGHLVNVSARNRVGTGDQVLIAGFVINGNQPKRLLIRGVGPGLTSQGVAGVLADPMIELHENRDGMDRVFAVNDNWSGEPDAAETAQQVGAFALAPGSRDAVLVVTLPAGVYTAVVRGNGQTSGDALVEIYAAD